MKTNLKDAMEFMTEAEKRELVTLLAKAEARERKQENVCEEHQFLFMGCKCECYGEMMQQNQENPKKVNFEDDVQKLLQQICNFCKKYRICFRENGKEGEEEGELPF